MNWIETLIKKSSPNLPYNTEENKLIKKLIKKAIDLSKEDLDFGLVIAAFYDLAISSVYYTNITNTGWLYCNLNAPKLILPFVNCCPEHALKGEFIFHKSSKPTSAKIGQATTRILLLFYQELFNSFNKKIDVLKAAEPADAIFYNKSEKKIFLGEIKSSPLLTMPLSMSCEPLTTYDNDGIIINLQHEATNNPFILNNSINIILPVRENGKWAPTYYDLGKKTSNSDDSFAYQGLNKLIENEEFISNYLNYWMASFAAYCKKDDSTNIFWLTNACGKPSKLPADWTGGVTCISDEKTSVGMDRTDDIKKGIYQVLKLGAEGKLKETGWDCKVGIISNIHPARHFNVYLKPIKDLIWTIGNKKSVKIAGDLDPNTPMYNLFDGVVTFTDNYIRDPWLSNNLKMIIK